MKNSRKYLWGLVSYLILFPLCQSLYATDSFIKPYRTAYEANYRFLLPFSGSATRELVQTEDGQWQLLHKVSSPMIKLEESSLFSWIDNQAKPISYHYRQSNLTKKREISLTFDWPNLQAISAITDEPIQIDIKPNCFDQLNYQLQLRYDLQVLGKPNPYDIVDRKRLKQYRFELLGEELVETPIGKLNTVKLKRLRKEGSPRETIIWLAKDWDFLLTKIHQKENGKSYEIVLSEGELAGKPITGL